MDGKQRDDAGKMMGLRCGGKKWAEEGKMRQLQTSCLS